MNFSPENVYVYVAGIFLFQLIFVFPLFLTSLAYYHTQKQRKNKNQLQHI